MADQAYVPPWGVIATTGQGYTPEYFSIDFDGTSNKINELSTNIESLELVTIQGVQVSGSCSSFIRLVPDMSNITPNDVNYFTIFLNEDLLSNIYPPNTSESFMTSGNCGFYTESGVEKLVPCIFELYNDNYATNISIGIYITSGDLEFDGEFAVYA